MTIVPSLFFDTSDGSKDAAIVQSSSESMSRLEGRGDITFDPDADEAVEAAVDAADDAAFDVLADAAFEEAAEAAETVFAEAAFEADEAAVLEAALLPHAVMTTRHPAHSIKVRPFIPFFIWAPFLYPILPTLSACLFPIR